MSASWYRSAAFSSLTLLASYAHHHSPSVTAQDAMCSILAKFGRMEDQGMCMPCQIVHAVQTTSWLYVRHLKSWVGVGQHTCLAKHRHIVKSSCMCAECTQPAGNCAA